MEAYDGYLRYMDDIRIFCKSEIEAKKALLRIIQCLRKYKLNINAKKTKIISPIDSKASLFDSKKPMLDAVQEAIDSRNKYRISAIMPIVNNLFIGGVDRNNPFDQRHLKFSLFRLGMLKSSGIDIEEKKTIEKIFENFVNNPQNANLFCDFFILFSKEEKIFNFLIKFLFSKDNIYEWQELHVLRCLLQLNIKPKKIILKKFHKRFKNKNLHWSVRSLYCLLIGKHSTQSDRELLVDEFANIEEMEIKKNIMLSVQELGIVSRNSFYTRVVGEVWPDSYARYLKGLNNILYLIPYERIIIDNFKDQDWIELY